MLEGPGLTIPSIGAVSPVGRFDLRPYSRILIFPFLFSHFSCIPSLGRYPLSWPGVKGVARRKHRPGEPFSRKLRPDSLKWGGPIGWPPVALTRMAKRHRGPGPVGPTGPGNGRCLMVSAGNALDSGLRKPRRTCLSSDFPKAKVGKPILPLTTLSLFGKNFESFGIPYTIYHLPKAGK